MCFCRYDIDSMYAKYQSIHSSEAKEATVGEWFMSASSGDKQLSHDGQTLLQLYELNLSTTSDRIKL